MKLEKSRPSAVSAAPHASVSYADYAALGIAHVRANGGEGVVLEGPRAPGHKPRQWRAWIAYFETLKPSMARTYASLNTITVPTAWPREFDLSAPLPPMFVGPDEKLISPARRRELAAMMRAFAASLGKWPEDPKAPTWDARLEPTPDLRAKAVAHHEGKLAELAKAGAPQVRTHELTKYLNKMQEDSTGELQAKKINPLD